MVGLWGGGYICRKGMERKRSGDCGGSGYLDCEQGYLLFMLLNTGN